MTALERLFARIAVDEATGCWEWTGYRNEKGYGRVRDGEARGKLAHVVAYGLLVGAVPAGRELDHLCRNRGCVNPAHLEPVTHRENVMRGEGVAVLNSRKTRCVNGHAFTDENTYRDPRGGRECRTCRAEATRRARRVA